MLYKRPERLANLLLALLASLLGSASEAPVFGCSAAVNTLTPKSNNLPLNVFSSFSITAYPIEAIPISNPKRFATFATFLDNKNYYFIMIPYNNYFRNVTIIRKFREVLSGNAGHLLIVAFYFIGSILILS